LGLELYATKINICVRLARHVCSAGQTLVLILGLSGFHSRFFFHSNLLFQFTPAEFCFEFIGVRTNPGNSNAKLHQNSCYCLFWSKLHYHL